MRKFLLMILCLSTTLSYTQENPATAETPQPTTDTPQEPTPEQQKQLADWSETMQYGISDQRLKVIKKIRANKDSNAIELIENFFPQEGNTPIKEEMIYTFLDLNHSNNTEFWNNIFTQESNLIILQRAAFAVEKMDIPVAPELFNAFTNQLTNNKAMRFNAAAAQALGQLKYADALPIIQEIATNITNHQDLRGSAVVAMGKYQDENMIPTLQGFLTNSSEPRLIRRYAALAIGLTQSPQAVDILSPIANDENEEQTVRLNSISGLGYLNDETIIPSLERLTRSDNTSVRIEAIKSLGRLKSENSQSILEYKAFNDPETVVRREAKTALQALGVDIVKFEEDRKNRNNPTANIPQENLATTENNETITP